MCQGAALANHRHISTVYLIIDTMKDTIVTTAGAPELQNPVSEVYKLHL